MMPDGVLELVELLARLGVDRLEVAFQRAVEDDAAGSRQSARPDRELLRIRPDDLAGLAVPGDEVAHVAVARRRIHRQGRADIGLPRGVAHLERLVIHADVVGRHVEELGLGRIGRRLLILGAQSRRADALGVDVLAIGLGRHRLDADRPSVVRRRLIHVDPGGPVHLRVELVGDEQFAGVAIERIAEAVAIEMRQAACDPYRRSPDR